MEELAAAREAKLLKEADEKHKKLQSEIDQLTATLNSVMDYKNRQVEVDEAMLRLKEENQELKEKLEQQKMELERYRTQ